MLPYHNARVKKYPDGSAEVLIGSRPFGGGSLNKLPAYMDDGEPPFVHVRDRVETEDMRAEREYYELEQAAKEAENADANAAACQAASVRRSVRRARKAVKDLARSNDWAYFVTLTLDPEKVNRYDPEEVLRHLRHWLGNNVRRKGLAYVLVPEHHKDGAIHFHGLFNDALEAVDSGTMSVPGRKAPVRVRSEAHRAALERMGGHTVYNLPGWGWGFSTAIQLYGEREAAINYVCKYIGKEMSGPQGTEFGTPAKIGGRWYYSGGALQRPEIEWFDVDIREWEHTPGWYTPDEYPFCSFLRMRITAEGEVLMPYIKEAEEETNVPRETEAEPGRGSDQPSTEGGHDSPGPSSGHDAEQVDESQPRVSSARSKTRDSIALTAPRPAHNPGKNTHLTFSGLSSGRDTLLPPGPRRTAQEKCQEFLSILEEFL